MHLEALLVLAHQLRAVRRAADVQQDPARGGGPCQEGWQGGAEGGGDGGGDGGGMKWEGGGSLGAIGRKARVRWGGAEWGD